MAIVRNIQTNDLYRFHGGNKFTNLRTGVSGDIPTEIAQSVLKINLEATEIFNEYPEVEKMIGVLGLKFEQEQK